MKKVLAAVIAALLAASPAAHATWVTAGPQTFAGTGINTVLADTGAIVAQNINFYVFCSCSTTAVSVCLAQAEHRNAANNANVNSQLMYMVNAAAVGAGNAQLVSLSIGIYLPNDNERFRVILATNITGTIQCSIFYE